MSSLGRKQYIILIADILVEEYGNTLSEFDTDIKMATKVVDKLSSVLDFSVDDISDEEFNKRKWCGKCIV